MRLMRVFAARCHAGRPIRRVPGSAAGELCGTEEGGSTVWLTLEALALLPDGSQPKSN